HPRDALRRARQVQPEQGSRGAGTHHRRARGRGAVRAAVARRGDASGRGRIMTPVLLRAARIVGAEATAGAPVDVLVRGGRIAGIAPRIEAPDAEVVALDGRFVMPGLWDGHVHTGQWAAVSRRLDLSSARSAAEAAALVRARPDAGWDAD